MIKKINWKASSFWFGWILIFLVNINIMASVSLDLGDIIVDVLKIKGNLIRKIIGFLLRLLWLYPLIQELLPFLILVIKLKILKKYIENLFLCFYYNFFIYLILFFILLVLLSGGHFAIIVEKQFKNVWYLVIKYNNFIPNFFAYILMALMLFFYIISFSSILFLQSEFIAKMSEEKDFFKIFQKRTKTNLPWPAILLIVFISCIYLMLDTIFIATTLIVLGVNILKILSLMAIIKLRKEHSDYRKIYKNWFFWFLVVFEVIAIVFIIMAVFFTIFEYFQQGVSIYKILKFSFVFMFIFLGFPVYICLKKIIQKNDLSNNAQVVVNE